MENYSQNRLAKRACSDLFGSLFATLSESRLLDACWSPFGSLCAPFWLPLVPFWLPFGSLWLPFGSLWLTFASLPPFWLPLAPVWFTLLPRWLTFGVLWLTFGVSWLHFSYFCLFSLKMSCKIICFMYFSLKSTFSVNQIALSRSTSSLVTSPQEPAAEHLPQAT